MDVIVCAHGSACWRERVVGGEHALCGHGCESARPMSLTFAHRAARPRPRAHPVILFTSTPTAPQAVPKPYQVHVPSSPAHTQPTEYQRLPALPLVLSPPGSPPAPPPRLRPRSLDSKVTLFLHRGGPHSQDIGLGLAQPGCTHRPRVPAPCRHPQSPAGRLITEDVLLAEIWSCWRDKEVTSGEGRGPQTVEQSQGCPPCQPGQAGEGAATGSGDADKLRSPAGERGPQGPAQRRAGPRLSRSPPARAQGLRPARATPLHKSFSQQSTSTFKIPELMKPIR